jgi:hypothetical protein
MLPMLAMAAQGRLDRVSSVGEVVAMQAGLNHASIKAVALLLAVLD